MRPYIWLSKGEHVWAMLANDEVGTLSISELARRTHLRPESLTMNRIGVVKGITIEDIRSISGPEVGNSAESAAPVDGVAEPAASTKDGEVDNSEHWISVMLPPPLLALHVNAKDVQDILFPTEETCRLPVLPSVYAHYQRNHPSVANKYLVKGDNSKFCITVSYMLDSDIPPPESEVDVITDCGGGAIKRIFRAFRGSEHGFAHKVLLNLAETSTTSESKSGARSKYTRPDTVVVVSDCTFLVEEDKLGRLHDAEEDLERKMMPLSQVFYGEVSGILCYAAAGTTFRWFFCSREKNLHPVSPDLDISMKTKFRCQYLLSIGRAYMLIKRMSEVVPRFAGRRAMFTVEENTNKTRSLAWFSDNILKTIRKFSEYCAAMNGSSLDNITKAHY